MYIVCSLYISYYISIFHVLVCPGNDGNGKFKFLLVYIFFSSNNDFKLFCFSMKQMKKNKILYESAMKQFEVLLPEDYKEPYKTALTKCKDSTGGAKNACDAAYNMLKCFYDNNSKFTFA